MIGRAIIKSLKYDHEISTLSLRNVDTDPDAVHFDVDICTLKQFVRDLDFLFYLTHVDNPANSITVFPQGFGKSIKISQHLVEALKYNDKNIKVVYFSSGGAVYGEHPVTQLGIREDSFCFPLSPYGAEKLTIENVLRIGSASASYSVIVLRLSNVYGGLLKIDSNQGIIGVLMNSVMHNRQVYIDTDFNPVRDYMHIDDLVDLIKKIVSADMLPKFKVFNIGTGVGTDLRTLLCLVSDKIKKPILISKCEFIRNEYQPVWNVLNIDIVKNFFCWTPAISLRDGIDKFLKEIIE